MPHSMTGFGRAQDSGESRLSCEIRSVNHRFLVSKIRLPSALQRFEPWIDAQLRKRLQRGSVEVQVQSSGTESAALPQIQEKVADHYLARIDAFLARRDLADRPGAEFLLQLPGVMQPPDPAELASTLGPRLKRVVSEALDAHVEMREREGARTEKVLRRELTRLRKATQRLRARSGKIVTESRRRLRSRLEELLDGSAGRLDKATLEREVAILADRSDVTEELDRLTGHVEEFSERLEVQGPVGRALDFLVQELGREVNTVGSKTQDQAATSLVLEAKGVVEKLKEQVQNLE